MKMSWGDMAMHGPRKALRRNLELGAPELGTGRSCGLVDVVFLWSALSLRYRAGFYLLMVAVLLQWSYLRFVDV